MIDLHIHTIYSDGEFNENQIIELVKKANINEFAICDHDTIVGSIKTAKVLKNSNSNLVFHSGIEFSCIVPKLFGGINVHILYRDFAYNNKTIKKYIEQSRKLRLKKIATMLERVKKVYNIEIPLNEVEKSIKKTSAFGKPHIFEILQKYGKFDREEFYKNMRGVSHNLKKIDATCLIKELKRSKGYATLAHPKEIMEEYGFDYDKIEQIIEYLKPFGLDALEVRHSKNTISDSKEFIKMAEKYSLKQTWGSDFHGPNVKPKVFLGKFEKDEKN